MNNSVVRIIDNAIIGTRKRKKKRKNHSGYLLFQIEKVTIQFGRGGVSFIHITPHSWWLTEKKTTPKPQNEDVLAAKRANYRKNRFYFFSIVMKLMNRLFSNFGKIVTVKSRFQLISSRRTLNSAQ